MSDDVARGETITHSGHGDAPAQRRADFTAFIDACCGGQTGKLFTPIGRGPHWNAAGTRAGLPDAEVRIVEGGGAYAAR